MGYVIVVPPAKEPVSLPEAKRHLRVDVDNTDDDELIDGYVVAARRHVEIQTRRSLITQTRKVTLDRFPVLGGVQLPYGPVTAVTAVGYLDATGVTQTLDPTAYAVGLDETVPAIWPVVASPWPATTVQPGAVSVTYTAGYGLAAAVPRVMKQAILLLIGHWYANREAVSVDALNTVPVAVDDLINDYRIPLMA